MGFQYRWWRKGSVVSSLNRIPQKPPAKLGGFFCRHTVPSPEFFAKQVVTLGVFFTVRPMADADRSRL